MQGVLFPDHPPSRMARVPGHEARGVGGPKGGRGQERTGSHADQDERGCAEVASQCCRGRDALLPGPNPVGIFVPPGRVACPVVVKPNGEHPTSSQFLGQTPERVVRNVLLEKERWTQDGCAPSLAIVRGVHPTKEGPFVGAEPKGCGVSGTTRHRLDRTGASREKVHAGPPWRGGGNVASTSRRHR